MPGFPQRVLPVVPLVAADVDPVTDTDSDTVDQPAEPGPSCQVPHSPESAKSETSRQVLSTPSPPPQEQLLQFDEGKSLTISIQDKSIIICSNNKASRKASKELYAITQQSNPEFDWFLCRLLDLLDLDSKIGRS